MGGRGGVVFGGRLGRGAARPAGRWFLRSVPVAACLGLVLSLCAGATPAQLASSSWPANVFAVGTFDGIPGNVTTTENVTSIQLAVNQAEAWADHHSCGSPPAPCDTYVLLAPGDYKTDPSSIEAPPSGQDPAGVLIDTDNVWLVGMDRNSVVIDGTQSGPTCSTDPTQQVYGPSAYAASPYSSQSPYQSSDGY
ncbi:MAG TPA: hypothetical protein VEJ21_02460, partial [Acidimicrobiales bacterium]|nr:hypothetical protein [Acidimicrobiales bacterium]